MNEDYLNELNKLADDEVLGRLQKAYYANKALFKHFNAVDGQINEWLGADFNAEIVAAVLEGLPNKIEILAELKKTIRLKGKHIQAAQQDEWYDLVVYAQEEMLLEEVEGLQKDFDSLLNAKDKKLMQLAEGLQSSLEGIYTDSRVLPQFGLGKKSSLETIASVITNTTKISIDGEDFNWNNSTPLLAPFFVNVTELIYSFNPFDSGAIRIINSFPNINKVVFRKTELYSIEDISRLSEIRVKSIVIEQLVLDYSDFSRMYGERLGLENIEQAFLDLDKEISIKNIQVDINVLSEFSDEDLFKQAFPLGKIQVENFKVIR